METILETLKYKNHTIDIVQDENAPNPRTEYDNVGKMICFHRHYSLGDKHNYSSPDDLQSRILSDFGPSPVILSLYLYDHSGITMSTPPFSCQWDSGQVGIIVCSRKTAIKEWGKKVFSSSVKKKALAYLESELIVYNKYLTGQFCGYVIKDKTGSTIDSLWAIDDTAYAISEAKNHIDCIVKDALNKRIAQLKAFIRNRVSLESRQLKFNA